MTPTKAEVAKIVAGLSKAQRDGLMRSPCPSWWGSTPGCMPHTRQTTFALYRKGLVVRVLISTNAAPLTPLGLAACAYLMENPDAE